MIRLAPLSMALLFGFSASADAQVGRDVMERGSNRAQISQGKKLAERDSQELAQFSKQVDALEAALESGDQAAANQALAALTKLGTAEVQQNAAKVEQAKKEVAGSVSETGSNRREARRNRDDSDAFGRSDDDEADAIRDGINRVDDARDLADDKKDLQALGQRAQRQQQIVAELGAAEAAAAEQVALLREFEGLMQADLAATQAEMKEDKREAAEDRRETRDDLREADEPDNRYRRETGDFGRRRR